MKAWAVDCYGGPEVLQCRKVAEPQCGPEDVVIEMKAAGVNPLDWKIRNGDLKLVRKSTFPLLMGSELSGVVREVGDRVSRFKVGDEVFSRVNKLRTGTWAERVAVDQSHVALKPSNLSHEEAGGFALAGLTAWQVLTEVAQVKAGQKVFIQAGAGGVGSLAIQMAKHLGAYVATTASAPKHDLVKSLGADEPIDYRSTNFETVLKDYDLVFDTLGPEAVKRSFEILKPGGLVVSITGPMEPEAARIMGLNPLLRAAIWAMSYGVRQKARRHDCRYRFFFMKEDGTQLAQLAGLIEEGALKPLVDKVFPFEEADKAVAYAERGSSSGKVIIAREN